MIKKNEVVIVTKCYKCGTVTEYTEEDINDKVINQNKNYDAFCLFCNSVCSYTYLHSKYANFVDEKWETINKKSNIEMNNFGVIRNSKTKKILNMTNNGLKKTFNIFGNEQCIYNLQTKFFNCRIRLKNDKSNRQLHKVRTYKKQKSEYSTFVEVTESEMYEIHNKMKDAGFDWFVKHYKIPSFNYRLKNLKFRPKELETIRKAFETQIYKTMVKKNKLCSYKRTELIKKAIYKRLKKHGLKFKDVENMTYETICYLKRLRAANRIMRKTAKKVIIALKIFIERAERKKGVYNESKNSFA